MTKYHFIYLIIVASIILMILNISGLDFNNIELGSFAGIISNLLLIIAMIITIRDLRKKENNQ